MDPAVALREHFGFDAFRPGQGDAVRAAIGPPPRDVLVVMPTGAGKSLCYQLPALLRDDLTLVVSPLVSLMQDQVDALARVAPGRVGVVNAQCDAAENRAAVSRAAAGELRLLYVAPERFSSAPFVDAMARTRVGLFVVDEAHCVSQWGHDFRPVYFRLGGAARRLGADAIIASTATATPRVACDIEERLGCAIPCACRRASIAPTCRSRSSHVRRRTSSTGRSRRRWRSRARGPRSSTPGRGPARSGSPPCCRERSTTTWASTTRGSGESGRAAVQRRFMDGALPVVVATNAFGMGIDRSDVRRSCHATVPGSIEAYYQEAGRAGRDGRPARALLFAEQHDKRLHVFFIRRGEPAESDRGAIGGRSSAADLRRARWQPLRATFVRRSEIGRRVERARQHRLDQRGIVRRKNTEAVADLIIQTRLADVELDVPCLFFRTCRVEAAARHERDVVRAIARRGGARDLFRNSRRYGGIAV